MKQTENNNKQNEQTEEEQKRIMEHMPYLNLLMEDIREINRALREGRSGVAETKIFMADVPKGWLDDVQTSINSVTLAQMAKYQHAAQFIKKGYSGDTKKYGDFKQLEAGREWSLSIKPLVLEALAKKDILLLTKKIPEGKMFRIDEEDDEND